MPYLQWFSTQDIPDVLKSLVLSADSLGVPRVLQAELCTLQEQFQVTFFCLNKGTCATPG